MKLPTPLARSFTALLVVAFSAALTAARAADHRDGPSILVDQTTDINDVYLFVSANTPSRTVLVLTANPFAGIFSATTFRPAVPYLFNIDHNGDALAEMQFKVTFSHVDRNGVQKLKLSHIANRRSVTIAEGPVGQPIQLSTGGQVIAGIFDDPFFFDFIAFRNNFAFTDPGDNFFHGVNTLAIVLEIPTAVLLAGSTRSRIDLWATVQRGSKQLDRMGRPAINSVLIPRARRDAFNAGLPKDDQEDFRADMIATLMAAPFSRTDPDAQGLANFLLPDILTYDCSQPSGFPNGRKLEDDVIDTELQLLLNNPSATDGVDNDGAPFLTAFPYLKPANP